MKQQVFEQMDPDTRIARRDEANEDRGNRKETILKSEGRCEHCTDPGDSIAQ